MIDGFVSVSEINEYVKHILSADENLTGLFVRGELSNFTHHIKSGHFYFTLKDEKTSIKAVMFKGSARFVKFKPENGMKVVIFGSVRVFERDGIYQLYCEDMQPDGIGALYLAFEQLKKKLEAKGYFDAERKRKIPQFPQKIVLVTAPTGAALQDMLQIISRRYPVAELSLFPVLVQGEQAPQAIKHAFDWLNRQSDDFTDLIIVARGGGSVEDLAAFNSETVADALYGSKFPVISAVGHETDFTIADFVADLRAPTPSAAAELAVPDMQALNNTLDNYESLLYNYTLSVLQRGGQLAKQLENRLQQASPKKTLLRHEDDISQAEKRLTSSVLTAYKEKGAAFQAAVDVLEALSPLKVLGRGYSITFSGGKPLAYAAGVRPGQQIETRLHQGSLISEVKEVNE